MMQKHDSEAIARQRRVQELCTQLSQLIAQSYKQRLVLDRLLAELASVAREADARRLRASHQPASSDGHTPDVSPLTDLKPRVQPSRSR
jgi:hypothetical protein